MTNARLYNLCHDMLMHQKRERVANKKLTVIAFENYRKALFYFRAFYCSIDGITKVVKVDMADMRIELETEIFKFVCYSSDMDIQKLRGLAVNEFYIDELPPEYKKESSA